MAVWSSIQSARPPGAAQPAIAFSDEQAMLVRNAREWLQEHSGFAAVRARLASERGYEPAVWSELSGLGWLGLALPEAYGGAGMPAGALVALCEPMGQRVFATPFLATTLAGQLLLASGDEAAMRAWLPRLGSGEAIGTVALTDAEGGFDVSAPLAQARADGEGYVLQGTKAGVLDAASADVLVVSAIVDGEAALFLLERAALAANALRREVLIDETRRSYRLKLDGVRLPASARLGGGDASAALVKAQQIGALLLAADMTGGTQGVMDLTVDYLDTRVQFGRKIGSYQALKHPMVELMVMHEQARSLVHHAATVLDAGGPQAEIAVRMAKALAGECYTQAADRAIQFHGAIGFTYECHAQLFLRRALWAEHTFGDSHHHLQRLEPLLLDGQLPR